MSLKCYYFFIIIIR